MSLPAGRVTFLFTDIEGSTRLLHAMGGLICGCSRPAPSSCFARLFLASMAALRSTPKATAFFVAFPLARRGRGFRGERRHSKAFADSLLAERRGASRFGWGSTKVSRRGLQRGIRRRRRPSGRAYLCRRARRPGAHLASARATSCRERGAPTSRLRDLGLHRLKDLPEPERLFQLVADGLAAQLSAAASPRGGDRGGRAARLLASASRRALSLQGSRCRSRPEDSELFFGREELVRAARRPARRRSTFLAVVGPSGSGKSSLVRAGVVPTLKPGSGDELRTAIFSPGAAPACGARRGRMSATCLVVDQFEEVFTLCRDEDERRAFIDALLAAAAPGGPVVHRPARRLLRHCAAYPRLPARWRRTRRCSGR